MHARCPSAVGLHRRRAASPKARSVKPCVARSLACRTRTRITHARSRPSSSGSRTVRKQGTSVHESQGNQHSPVPHDRRGRKTSCKTVNTGDPAQRKPAVKQIYAQIRSECCSEVRDEGTENVKTDSLCSCFCLIASLEEAALRTMQQDGEGRRESRVSHGCSTSINWLILFTVSQGKTNQASDHRRHNQLFSRVLLWRLSVVLLWLRTAGMLRTYDRLEISPEEVSKTGCRAFMVEVLEA